MYLTYDEYQKLGGTLTEPTFNRYELRAEKLIDARTFDRIKTEDPVRDCVKALVYELVTQLQQSGIMEDTAQVSSYSNDGVNVTYASRTRTEVDSDMRELIEEYLYGETDARGCPLLALGVRYVPR